MPPGSSLLGNRASKDLKNAFPQPPRPNLDEKILDFKPELEP